MDIPADVVSDIVAWRERVLYMELSLNEVHQLVSRSFFNLYYAVVHPQDHIVAFRLTGTPPFWGNGYLAYWGLQACTLYAFFSDLHILCWHHLLSTGI